MRSEKSTNRQKGRTRSWTLIVYPESAPKDWKDVLDSEHIKWVESPLHDRDVNATGDVKKSHYHILLLFESVKSYEQVKEITEKLNAPIPQKCNDVKALVRYMAHLDNPEKVQYGVSDIVAHGGADVGELLKSSHSERYQYIKEMTDYIVKNNIIEFEDILLYAVNERYEDWFPLLCDSCAMVISKFLSSRRHRRQPAETVRVVKVNENGEVISEEQLEVERGVIND
jgi:hypothetical protein